MEEKNLKIRKIIVELENEKSYSIDVDENTTFYEFKKILAGAAHLLKNSYRILVQEKELTKDYDDNTIQEIFPDDPVTLRIISDKGIKEYEDELISVRLNVTVPCTDHIGKLKVLYCFTCNKSICFDCFTQTHKNHKAEEKSDYLVSAKILMNNIFSNSLFYKADPRLSKYDECFIFRANLKLNVFDNLRKSINELENKFFSCLDYFSFCEYETEKNTNENLELLKKFCIESYINLKNEINTKGIMIDDEIFLTLHNKLREIEIYKNKCFEENKYKYEKLNSLFAPFIQQVEYISNELKITIDNYLNKDIYDKFKQSVGENVVEKIKKDQVNDITFKNLGVQRKYINRNTFGANRAYRKAGKNANISPDKLLMHERSPFQKAFYSFQPQGPGELLENNSLGKAESEKKSPIFFTFSKNKDQKSKINDSLVISGNEISNHILSTIITNNNNINNIEGDITNLERKDKEIHIDGLNNMLTDKNSNATTTTTNMNSQVMNRIPNNNIVAGKLNLNLDSNNNIYHINKFHKDF